MAKKYYWLKLTDNFFDQREIKKLRRIAGGDTFTIIYLKLQLLSLKTNATFIYEGTEDNIFEQLALEIDEEIENIKMTLAFLQKNNLIEQIENDTYFLNKASDNMGSETDAAERMRIMRSKQKQLQKCNNVTDECNDVQNGYTEIDIEKEKEKI